MLKPPTRSWLDDVTGFGKITVEPLEWLPLEFVCFHLRAIDAEEIYDNLPEANALEFSAMLFHAIAKNGCAWIARFNGRPAGVLGVAQNFPGNWQVFSFGTDNYPRVAVAFKPKIDNMIGFARERGMHRLECRSLASHVTAHRYIRLVGLTPDCVLHKFGSHGQDYILFSRIW